MMLGGGGNRGGGPRGRTLRERAGGALGGLVGVAGALTGSHRSLGGLSNAMVSGGATGSQLGSALGRKFVGRRGQARADLREAGKQASAEKDAKMMEETRSRGEGFGSRLNPYATYAGVRRRINPNFQSNERLESMAFNPLAAVRRSNFAAGQAEDERLRQATQRNQAVDATRAEQDKENKRMGVAVRQGMYRDAGRKMGEEANHYEEMGRKVEEMVPNFVQGMDSVDAAMQQAQTIPPQNRIGVINATAPTPSMSADSQLTGQDVQVTNNPKNYDDKIEVEPPQGDASTLNPNSQVAVQNMNTPEQIEAAKRMAESRKGQME